MFATVFEEMLECKAQVLPDVCVGTLISPQKLGASKHEAFIDLPNIFRKPFGLGYIFVRRNLFLFLV